MNLAKAQSIVRTRGYLSGMSLKQRVLVQDEKPLERFVPPNKEYIENLIKEIPDTTGVTVESRYAHTEFHIKFDGLTISWIAGNAVLISSLAISHLTSKPDDSRDYTITVVDEEHFKQTLKLVIEHGRVLARFVAEKKLLERKVNVLRG